MGLLSLYVSSLKRVVIGLKFLIIRKCDKHRKTQRSRTMKHPNKHCIRLHPYMLHLSKLSPTCVRCLGLPCVNTVSFHSLFTRLPHEYLRFSAYMPRVHTMFYGTYVFERNCPYSVCKSIIFRKSLLSRFLQMGGDFIFVLCFFWRRGERSPAMVSVLLKGLVRKYCCRNV